MSPLMQCRMWLNVVLILIIVLCILKSVFASNEAKPKEGVNLNNVQNDVEEKFEWDPKGYVIFCLCMGRLGNQAEHFLGGMAFAKAIDRTLILPPWRTYRNVGFREWFDYDTMKQYHRVITAEDFMKHLAAEHWPPRKRTGFCWLPAGSTTKCQLKDGDPFGPFWDGLNVDFVNYEVYHFSFAEYRKWGSEYPPDKFPVIAMRGAPASFPMSPKDWPLQRFLVFSEKVQQEADKYIHDNFPGEKFVGIHLRNGVDWENACDRAEGLSNYMATPQCLHGTSQKLTKKMCFPPLEEVLRLIKKAVFQIKAKVVFVATDKKPLIKEIENHLFEQKVKVYHADPWLPLTDWAILIESDVFIGNCVSSFTSFVTRARLVQNKPTLFWGFS